VLVFRNIGIGLQSDTISLIFSSSSGALAAMAHLMTIIKFFIISYVLAGSSMMSLLLDAFNEII
jgi:hypothetical protein